MFFILSHGEALLAAVINACRDARTGDTDPAIQVADPVLIFPLTGYSAKSISRIKTFWKDTHRVDKNGGHRDVGHHIEVLALHNRSHDEWFVGVMSRLIEEDPLWNSLCATVLPSLFDEGCLKPGDTLPRTLAHGYAKLVIPIHVSLFIRTHWHFLIYL